MHHTRHLLDFMTSLRSIGKIISSRYLSIEIQDLILHAAT